MSLDPALIDCVETGVLPGYTAFDGAHGPDHVRMTIRRSLDLEMVCVIAAWHGLGLSAGREHHHLFSAELLTAGCLPVPALSGRSATGSATGSAPDHSLRRNSCGTNSER